MMMNDNDNNNLRVPIWRGKSNVEGVAFHFTIDHRTEKSWKKEWICIINLYKADILFILLNNEDKEKLKILKEHRCKMENLKDLETALFTLDNRKSMYYAWENINELHKLNYIKPVCMLAYITDNDKKKFELEGRGCWWFLHRTALKWKMWNI